MSNNYNFMALDKFIMSYLFFDEKGRKGLENVSTNEPGEPATS